MSSKITELIEQMSNDTNSAMSTTESSLKQLMKSKKFMEELKNMSNQLINYNKEVLDTINLFVEDARNVRNITEGIAQMSSSIVELAAYTEEALGIYEENKIKTNNTKVVMNKVEEAMKELVNV